MGSFAQVIPEWLAEELRQARRKLGIGDEWRISLRLVSAPDGDKKNDGACSADSVYLQATIELQKRLSPGLMARQIILHECGHIAHSEIDRLVETYILADILDESQRQIFRNMYNDALERFLERLTRAMTGDE